MRNNNVKIVKNVFTKKFYGPQTVKDTIKMRTSPHFRDQLYA